MNDNNLIICPKCNKVISYSSYFQRYICDNCGWEKRNFEGEKEIKVMDNDVRVKVITGKNPEDFEKKLNEFIGYINITENYTITYTILNIKFTTNNGSYVAFIQYRENKRREPKYEHTSTIVTRFETGDAE